MDDTAENRPGSGGGKADADATCRCCGRAVPSARDRMRTDDGGCFCAACYHGLLTPGRMEHAVD